MDIEEKEDSQLSKVRENLQTEEKNKRPGKDDHFKKNKRIQHTERKIIYIENKEGDFIELTDLEEKNSNDRNFQIDILKKFKDLKLKKRTNKIQFMSYEQQIIIINKYQTHDTSSKEISFHYNPNGSHAIFFTASCNHNVLSKAVGFRNDFQFLYYNIHSVILLVGPTLDFSNFDEKYQWYENNQLPLHAFISIKFDQQQKILNDIGISFKKQILNSQIISNQRLKVDLFELLECLDNQFNFKKDLCNEHCYAYYTQVEDLNTLEGLIIGPKDTPYEGIPYTLTIKVPTQYPLCPPTVTFNQQILHPNISADGKVCLDILASQWSAALTIQKVLMSIISLLYEKNLDDVYNHYAKRLYIEDPEELRKQIKNQAILSGCQNLMPNSPNEINNEKNQINSTDLQKAKIVIEEDYEENNEELRYEEEDENDYNNNKQNENEEKEEEKTNDKKENLQY